jgi:hypothetical protein
MKKQVLLFIFIITSAFANAQIPNFQWAKSIGCGETNVSGFSITVDAFGNVYTTGGFYCDTVDFDPGAGTYNLINANGYDDIFISKLDASGNFVWAKSMFGGQSMNCEGYSIVVDKLGNVYTTGRFQGTVDFDPNAGVYNLTSGGVGVFVSKLDANGNFVWAKSMGGYGATGYSIALDLAGNVYVTGGFYGIIDFDPNAGTFNLTSAGQEDIFICKLDSLGNLVWAKQTGNSLYDEARCLALDSVGNVYTLGEFDGTVDFDPNAGVYNLTGVNGRDIFISKLGVSGAFIWAKQIECTGTAECYSNALDKSGNVYISGRFFGTADFDPGPGVYNITPQGPEIFLCKLDSSGNFVWVKTMGGGNIFGNSIAVDVFGMAYITGEYSGTVDFDPNAGVYNLTSSIGSSDIFMTKLDVSGNLLWAVSMVGRPQSGNSGKSIVVDKFGNNVYTTGWFNDTVDFNPSQGVYNIAAKASPSYDTFIHKMSQSEVGVSENPNPNPNTIYPNPSNGLYTIDLSVKSEITICNVLGEIILTQTMEAGKQALNLQQQASGIYFVRLVSEGKQEGFKLVKEE